MSTGQSQSLYRTLASLKKIRPSGEAQSHGQRICREQGVTLFMVVQAALAVLIRSCNSLQEIGHCLFDYALKHPREYELIASRIVITTHQPRPNFEYVVQKAGEWLGGEAEQYRPLIIALWALIHGTAMLLINDVIPEYKTTVRSAFSIALEELVRNHARFTKSP